MNKTNTILLALSLLLISAGANAQKYMTRTGKISFYSSTPMENIEAYNNEVASIADAGTGDLVFQVPIKSFKFEKALMQEHFNENYMESDTYHARGNTGCSGTRQYCDQRHDDDDPDKI